MEHSDAQPTECSYMPKKLMSTNNFLIGLVFFFIFIYWVTGPKK